jgi:hypothetical protein
MTTIAPLVAAIAIPGGIGGLAIWIILVAAIAAVVFVATQAMGVPIPGWVTQVFWILVIAVVCIAAVKFLLAM